MSENPFRSFILCIEFDQQISQLHQRIEQFYKEITTATARAQELTLRLQEHKTQFHAARSQVAAQELESLTLLQREKSIRSQQMLVSSPKEFLALEHELKENLQQREASEQKLFELFLILQSAEELFMVTEQATMQACRERDEIIADRERLIEQRKLEIIILQEQREQCAATAAPEMLEKYKTMLVNASDPVVPVVDNACSVCGFQVMSVDVLAMRRNVLVSCKECFRLLYSK